jgi:hypothetical protein
LFITDVEKNINNKNYGKALSLLKDVESSKFLDSDKRIELIEKVNEGFNKDLAKSNIKNLILNKTGSEAVGFELENTDGNKITKKDISSGLNELLSETNKDGSAKYSASNIIELSIGNNASVPFYKESLISGVANIADTGNKEKVLQGYELYKLFEVQNADETLTKTYKIAQSDIESYQRLDYSINVLGETFDSALNREIRTRAGNFKEKNIDDKKIDSRINELDFKGRGLFDFGEPNVNNIQAVENILKYTANMYFKAGGSEDTALDAAEKFLEKKLEEAELSGESKLITRDEIEELEELKAVREAAPQMMERLELKARYPGITDDLLDSILIDDNPQRKAEVLATLDEAFAMMRKGKGPDEVLRIIKDMNRTKQADGGSIDGDVSLTVIKIPDISESGVESLFKRR